MTYMLPYALHVPAVDSPALPNPANASGFEFGHDLGRKRKLWCSAVQAAFKHGDSRVVLLNATVTPAGRTPAQYFEAAAVFAFLADAAPVDAWSRSTLLAALAADWMLANYEAEGHVWWDPASKSLMESGSAPLSRIFCLDFPEAAWTDAWRVNPFRRP